MNKIQPAISHEQWLRHALIVNSEELKWYWDYETGSFTEKCPKRPFWGTLVFYTEHDNTKFNLLYIDKMVKIPFGISTGYSIDYIDFRTYPKEQYIIFHDYFWYRWFTNIHVSSFLKLHRLKNRLFK